MKQLGELSWNGVAAVFAELAALASSVQSYVSWTGRNDLMKGITAYTISGHCAAAMNSTMKLAMTPLPWLTNPSQETQLATIVSVVDTASMLVNELDLIARERKRLGRSTAGLDLKIQEKLDRLPKTMASFGKASPTMKDFKTFIARAHGIRDLLGDTCNGTTNSLMGSF